MNTLYHLLFSCYRTHPLPDPASKPWNKLALVSLIGTSAPSQTTLPCNAVLYNGFCPLSDDPEKLPHFSFMVDEYRQGEFPKITFPPPSVICDVSICQLLSIPRASIFRTARATVQRCFVKKNLFQRRKRGKKGWVDLLQHRSKIDIEY